MDKVGRKCRDISFKSEKNQTIVCVHSREVREYARLLEQDSNVISYEVCYALELERYQFVNPLDIRKDYLNMRWTSDFVLNYKDGTIGIREITTEDSLTKRSTIEQLEFSRRYWSISQAADWKVVIMEKGV